MSFNYYEEKKLSNSQDNFNGTKEQNKLDQIKGIPKLLETLNRNLQDIDSKLNSTRGKSQTGRVNTNNDPNDIKNIVKMSVDGLNDIFNVRLNKTQLSVNNNGSCKNVLNPLAFSVIKEEPLREANRNDEYIKSIKQEKSQNNIRKVKTASTETIVKTNTLVKRDSTKSTNLNARAINQDLSSSSHNTNLTTNSNLQSNMSLNYSYKVNKHRSAIDKNLTKKNILNTGGDSRNNKINPNTDADTSYTTSTKDSNTKLSKNIQMIKEKIENKITPQNISQSTQAPTLQSISTFSVPMQSVSNNTAKKSNSNVNHLNMSITSPIKQNLNHRMISAHIKTNVEINLNKLINPTSNKTVKRASSPKGRYETLEEDMPLDSIVLKSIADKEFFDRSKSPLIKDYKLKPKAQISSDNSMNITGFSRTAVKKNTMPVESAPESLNASSNYMSETKVPGPKLNQKNSGGKVAARKKSSKSKNSLQDDYSSKQSDDITMTNEFYVNTLENTGDNAKKISNFLEENTRFNFQSFHQMSFIINELARHKNIQGFDDKLLSSDLSELFISLFNHNSDHDLSKKSKMEKRSKYNINKVILIQTHWRKYYTKRIFETKHFNFNIKGTGSPESIDQIRNYLINRMDENNRLKKLSSMFVSCMEEFNKILNTDKNFNDVMQDYILISKENVSTQEQNHVYKNFITREGKVDKKFGPKIEKKILTQLKKENLDQSSRSLRKTATNLNSTAVTNPSELSGRSFINERCPEVETLSQSILLSKSQIKHSHREENAQIKSPKVDRLKKKSPVVNSNVKHTHDTEMELRLMKKELERNLDL